MDYKWFVLNISGVFALLSPVDEPAKTIWSFLPTQQTPYPQSLSFPLVLAYSQLGANLIISPSLQLLLLYSKISWASVNLMSMYSVQEDGKNLNPSFRKISQIAMLYGCRISSILTTFKIQSSKERIQSPVFQLPTWTIFQLILLKLVKKQVHQKAVSSFLR